MAEGRSVRLYFPEGRPTGLLTAEIVNWTGHILAGPRAKLAAAMKRDEIKRTGVYILYGQELNDDFPTVYIGEGDDLSKRLVSHSKDNSKDFWDRFVSITNKDLNLTKAHVRFLESQLIARAKTAKKSIVINATEPESKGLPEADISDMLAFLDEIDLLLPVIGVSLFRSDNEKLNRMSDEPNGTDQKILFSLQHHSKGISALARESDGEFVVLKGSKGDLNESTSFHEKQKNLREQVLKSGRAVKTSETQFELLDDVAFSSPSAASVFLFGTSRNGRTDWIVKGRSTNYGQWKDGELEAVAQSEKLRM